MILFHIKSSFFCYQLLFSSVSKLSTICLCFDSTKDFNLSIDLDLLLSPTKDFNLSIDLSINISIDLSINLAIFGCKTKKDYFES